LFGSLVELTPKDDAVDTSGDVKSPIELAAEFIKQIIEDFNFRSLIFNLDDIKTRIDIDNKTPY